MQSHLAARLAGADRASGPGHKGVDQASWLTDQATADWPIRTEPDDLDRDGEDHINSAAVAAYCESIRAGAPLSERKLARMFGKTSRRWARHRMAEARQDSPHAMAGSSA